MKCEMRKLGLSPQFEAIPTICVSAPAARALLTSTCPTPHGFTPSLALIRLCRRAKLQYDEVNCDVNAIKARFHGWAYSAHTSKHNMHQMHTACGHRMAHRKWKETKQLPSMLPGPAVPGCCSLYFHFLWAIHPIRPVQASPLTVTMLGPEL